MLPLEMWLRSAGRILLWFLAVVLGLVVLVNALTHSSSRPAPVPCSSACVFHPHAPHGPGPGMSAAP